MPFDEFFALFLATPRPLAPPRKFELGAPRSERPPLVELAGASLGASLGVSLGASEGASSASLEAMESLGAPLPVNIYKVSEIMAQNGQYFIFLSFKPDFILNRYVEKIC